MTDSRRNYQEQTGSSRGHGIVSGPGPSTEEIQQRFDRAYGQVRTGRYASGDEA